MEERVKQREGEEERDEQADTRVQIKLRQNTLLPAHSHIHTYISGDICGYKRTIHIQIICTWKKPYWGVNLFWAACHRTWNRDLDDNGDKYGFCETFVQKCYPWFYPWYQSWSSERGISERLASRCDWNEEVLQYAHCFLSSVSFRGLFPCSQATGYGDMICRCMFKHCWHFLVRVWRWTDAVTFGWLPFRDSNFRFWSDESKHWVLHTNVLMHLSVAV